MAVFVIKNVHSEMLFVNLKLVFFNGPRSINYTFNTIFLRISLKKYLVYYGSATGDSNSRQFQINFSFEAA